MEKRFMNVTIVREKPNFIWLVVISHAETKCWGEYTEHTAFNSLDDARKYLFKEIKKTGREMADEYPSNYSSQFSVWEDDCSCSFSIYDSKNLVDRYEGHIYKKVVY